MTTDVRSAAAQAGVCDEQLLVMNVLAALVSCETVTACAHVWCSYVEPVEASIGQDTLAQLGRALRIRMAVISPFD
jgi:hypothetical protein